MVVRQDILCKRSTKVQGVRRGVMTKEGQGKQSIEKTPKHKKGLRTRHNIKIMIRNRKKELIAKRRDRDGQRYCMVIDNWRGSRNENEA